MTMEVLSNKFAVFILTHGRPDKVITYKTLRKLGYTGRIFIIVDNEDTTRDKYIQNFGEKNVIIFDKKHAANWVDTMDNFDGRKGVVYARNAAFPLASLEGLKNFLVLDDDYNGIVYRLDDKREHPTRGYTVKNQLNNIFEAYLQYYKSLGAASIAMSQGGDWAGGQRLFGMPPIRKAMNSFFCSVERPFKFIGRINEDVNTYISEQARGNWFMTIPFIQINQTQTQANPEGMTTLYLDYGTYVKSFYTVICAPSCVKVNTMGRTMRRLHHCVKWDNAAPKIIEEKYRKVILSNP